MIKQKLFELINFALSLLDKDLIDRNGCNDMINSYIKYYGRA